MNQPENKWQIDAKYFEERYLFYDILIPISPNKKCKKEREERQQYYADMYIQATTGHVDHLLPIQLINNDSNNNN